MISDKGRGLDPQTAKRQGFGAMGLSGILAVIIGCGGGGGSSSGNSGGSAPTGVAAIRTSSIASVQSLNAGIAFPFAAVQDSAPSGSVIKALASLKSLRGQTLTYNSALNLYSSDPTGTGGTKTISYFMDSAGTQPAGSMILQAPGGSFTFSNYPATVSMNVNVTAGNVPCKGNASIVFQGSTGKNEIKGSLDLIKNEEQLSVDLDLSDSGQVSGTMQVAESNTTLSITNISGDLFGPLACSFTMAPQGYAGTGTIDLADATEFLHFTNPANTTSSTDASGNLEIQYPDGSKETITNPISALLSGTVGTSGSTSTSGSTGTTTTTTGNAMFEAPVATQWAAQGHTGYALGGSNKNGEVVGTDQINIVPVFAASVTSSVQVLDNNSQGGVANAINSNASIVGATYGEDQHAVYWTSPTAKAAILKFPSNLTDATASGINDGGQIVGTGRDGSTTYGLYWSSPTATPVTFTIPIETANPEINNAGQIFVSSEFGAGYVFSSYSGSGTYLSATSPSSGNQSSVSGNGAFSAAGAVGASAPTAYLGTATFWPSPSFSPQTLSVPGGFAYSGANAINDAGEITGWFNSSLGGTFHLALWEPGKTAIDLNSLFPSGVTVVQGVAMLNDGSVITTTHTAGTQYFLKRKH